jgi:hypothetical protein
MPRLPSKNTACIWRVVHFATAFKKPTVLTHHSDIVRQQRLMKIYKPLMRRFLGSVDRIVATSQNYIETSDILSDYRQKTEVIPIGLDRSTYPASDPAPLTKWRAEIGERLGLSIGNSPGSAMGGHGETIQVRVGGTSVWSVVASGTSARKIIAGCMLDWRRYKGRRVVGWTT